MVRRPHLHVEIVPPEGQREHADEDGRVACERGHELQVPVAHRRRRLPLQHAEVVAPEVGQRGAEALVELVVGLCEQAAGPTRLKQLLHEERYPSWSLLHH